jgi:peptidyl-dipeptidase A
MKIRVVLVSLAAVLALGLTPAPQEANRSDDPNIFVEAAEAELDGLFRAQANADWIAANFITYDSQKIAAAAQELVTAKVIELAKAAARFDGMDVSPRTARKLAFLKLALPVPAPDDPALIAELAAKSNALTGTYGSHRYCNEDGECLAEPEMVNIMATSRDPDELLEVWKGWRTMAPPMREDYVRVMEIANAGAKELGFDDLGSMWRSNYDMDPDAFAAEAERLLGQIQPLYEALQCHVRAKLSEFYGSQIVPEQGPIPAYLLGNMWAQSWLNVSDLVAPETSADGFDLGANLRAAGLEARDMVRTGEAFFTSLGFDPLPDTFWERSLFTKPRDRDVVCHASAWDMGDGEDYRIKMCIEPTPEMFETIHHELGHNFYQRAYRDQPPLFRGGANPGFHEAIGDAISLSITPGYLAQIGLIESEPNDSDDIGLLLGMALDRVAAMPWTYLVDQWRWGISSGKTPPEAMNVSWWELREKYQGVGPPEVRGDDFFDPGAKYHVPAMVSYTRYFIARILQFQFYRALCDAAGYAGPLHRCSFFSSKEAGARLNTMLEMGASQPWPDALESLTGTREMDASAINDYFAPLHAWLDEQNASRQCGW